jgi:hypothetical protein
MNAREQEPYYDLSIHERESLRADGAKTAMTCLMHQPYHHFAPSHMSLAVLPHVMQGCPVFVGPASSRDLDSVAC